MLKVIITGVIAVLAAGGCDDLDAAPGKKTGIDHSEEHPSSTVDVGDPFLAELDHVWVGPAGSGFAMVGYDAHQNEIGRISIYPLGSDLLRITHEYPRPCENPSSEECADIWDITVSFAGEPGDHRADIYQTLPGAVFSQRQAALFALVDAADPAGSPLLCTFGILASGAACFATPPPWVAGTCPAAVLGAVCACREGLENWDHDIDLDAVCGED